MISFFLPPVPTLTDKVAESLALDGFQYGQGLLPAKTHRLDHYVIHDKNRDDYLDPEDSVFFDVWGGGREFHQIEQDSAEFKEYLARRFDHRNGRRLWLGGAQQYLKVHEWPGSPETVLDSGKSALATGEQDMKDFADAEEFALLNGLDFDGKAFLAKIKANLEGQFDLCVPQLDYSLNYFIQNGSSSFSQKLGYCHRLAEAIDFYFGEYRKDGLAASENRAASMGVPTTSPH